VAPPGLMSSSCLVQCICTYAEATLPRRILIAYDNRDSAETMSMLLRLSRNEVHLVTCELEKDRVSIRSPSAYAIGAAGGARETVGRE
jgi:hypothetical protein